MEKQSNTDIVQSLEDRYRMFKLSDAALKAYNSRINRIGDNIVFISLFLLFLFSCICAAWFNTWSAALSIGLGCILLYAIPVITIPKRGLHRYTVAISFAVLSCFIIHQMQGLAEMYFFSAIGGILLAVYQRPKYIIVFASVIFCHHILFSYLQYIDVPNIYFTRSMKGFADIKTVGLHLTLLFIVYGFGIYFALLLRKFGINAFRYRKFLEYQLRYADENILLAEAMANDRAIEEPSQHDNDPMQKSLVKLHTNLKAFRESEHREKYVNNGLSKMNDILRNYALDFDTVASKLICELVTYFDANQAGMFVLEEGQDATHLELVAFYAYERHKYANKRIKLGEGLVGQAFLEEETIHLTEIPKRYITVTSGLGDAPPRSLLIVPLRFNEEVHGVIEMASFHKFEKHHMELIQKLSESIGSSVASHRNSAYNQELLEESQSLAERMTKQEEEMRQNIEELQATQEELQRKETSRMEEIAKLEEQLRAREQQHHKTLQALGTLRQDKETVEDLFAAERAAMESEINALKEQLTSR